MIAAGAYRAIEGNDGLGERGGGWGGGRGRAIVVILTTHNGRLLHLQTTGVQAKGKRKMETNENEGKKQVCETVQLLITKVVCGYRRLIIGQTFMYLIKPEAAPNISFTLTLLF